MKFVPGMIVTPSDISSTCLYSLSGDCLTGRLEYVGKPMFNNYYTVIAVINLEQKDQPQDGTAVHLLLLSTAGKLDWTYALAAAKKTYMWSIVR